MTRNAITLLLTAVCCGVVAALAWPCCPPPAVELRLATGGHARIAPASLLKSIIGAKCKITIEAAPGQKNTIDLWQDFFHGPILIIPSNSSNVFLCLYEDDTGLALLRIDQNRRPVPNSTANPGVSAQIVCAASCLVTDARLADWRYALDYLRRMASASATSQVVTAFPVGFDRRWRLAFTLDRVESQTKLMIANGADEWPVTRTLAYPLDEGTNEGGVRVPNK